MKLLESVDGCAGKTVLGCKFEAGTIDAARVGIRFSDGTGIVIGYESGGYYGDNSVSLCVETDLEVPERHEIGLCDEGEYEAWYEEDQRRRAAIEAAEREKMASNEYATYQKLKQKFDGGTVGPSTSTLVSTTSLPGFVFVVSGE